jgi:hypothetical protein
MITGHRYRTVSRFISKIRSMVVNHIRPSEIQIGGPGMTVEVDESYLERGINLKHQEDGTWVIGGVERGSTGKMFIVQVTDRTAKTIEIVLKKFVRSGTTIVTDCNPSYKFIERCKQFSHVRVNHGRGFVDKNNGQTTNRIESTWKGLKSKISKRDRRYGETLGYKIAEYIWRRQNKNSLWKGFLDVIRDTHFEF